MRKKRNRLWYLSTGYSCIAPGVATPAYNGYHDVADCTTIAGWAWDSNRPTTPASVDIYDGSTLLTTAQANAFRQDLLNAGIGDGSHSFTLATPNTLKDGNAHLISIKYAGTQTNLNTSPKPLTCAPPAAVSLTSPANNATATAPGSFTLTASTTGAIARVDFYASNSATNTSILVGTATTATNGSYSHTWSNIAAGSYSITAQATDTLNATTTSTPVSVTVNTGIAQAYYIHTDHLDTPRLITDTQGNTVWEWQNQDPYGNNMPNENPNGAGQFSFNLRFPGQYADRETNTYYNINRDYDPATGRYVQSDPIGLEAGINTYTYVLDNPLMYTDPLGLFNFAKGTSAIGNAAIAGFSAASGSIKLAIAAGLSPASATGVGALPPAALLGWGTWNLKSAAAAWGRAQQQWREARCEDASQGTWKNFYGMLPGGTSYDDPGEASGPLDYIQNQGWWKFISHTGYF